MKNYFTLTEREKEVKELIFKGLTHREIANELIVSTHTARAHVNNILRKLGFNSKKEMLLDEIENLKSQITNNNNSSNNDNNNVIYIHKIGVNNNGRTVFKVSKRPD